MRLEIEIMGTCVNPSCPRHVESVVDRLTFEPAGEIATLDYPASLVLRQCDLCGQSLEAVGQLFTVDDGQTVRCDYYRDYMDGWNIRFDSCRIHSQITGSESTKLLATVNFTIKKVADTYGAEYMQLQCFIHQPAGGSDYEQHTIEVHTPPELLGEINYREFSDSVERYYRSIIGSSGNIFNGERVNNAFAENVDIIYPGHGMIHGASLSGGGW